MPRSPVEFSRHENRRWTSSRSTPPTSPTSALPRRRRVRPPLYPRWAGLIAELLDLASDQLEPAADDPAAVVEIIRRNLRAPNYRDVLRRVLRSRRDPATGRTFTPTQELVARLNLARIITPTTTRASSTAPPPDQASPAPGSLLRQQRRRHPLGNRRHPHRRRTAHPVAHGHHHQCPRHPRAGPDTGHDGAGPGVRAFPAAPPTPQARTGPAAAVDYGGVGVRWWQYGEQRHKPTTRPPTPAPPQPSGPPTRRRPDHQSNPPTGRRHRTPGRRSDKALPWHRSTDPAPRYRGRVASKGGALSRYGIDAIVARHVETAKRSCPSLATKSVSTHTLRHTCAMRLLHARIDTTVIALWLGHESVETTQIYVHADMTLKERALARTTPIGTKPGRFQPTDQLLAFLEGL